MLFRDHPLFTYKKSRSWPPNWLYCGGFENSHPQGEVGILKNVFVSSVKPSNRCFLIMEHADAEYIGDLLVSDDAFCTQIYEMLLGHCGKTIQEIGDIDLIFTPLSRGRRRVRSVLLRDHPLMRYHGVPNWPPTWTWIDGFENKRPQGEIGILKAIELSNVQPANRFFLCIEYEQSSYIGCLLFDDIAFCRRITEILKSCCNRSISDIGSLDLSFTL
jgi:hypothetical protein